MRHGRHYVDAVLGDAPLRTVREIAISEIDPPDADMDALDLDRLEESIRRLGVIEPLLVGKRDGQYRVIAGMRRLRAARTVGLNTVPCLVHDVDDERFTDMRDAAAERHAPPPPAAVPAAAAEPAEAAPDTSLEALPIDDRLRSIVLNELASVESLRSKIASAAADFLARTAPVLEVAPASTDALIGDAIAAVGLEARLRGVRVERVDVIGQQPDYRISIDAARCRMALTGLLQCVLSLTPGAGTVLEVRSHVTTIRPALIVECRLRANFRPLGDAALARFFDPDWTEHPCGHTGAQVLAAVARVARAHHGRVQAHADGAVTFVVPRPLSDV
ncbi:MAG TPA: ParB N-terminal domain-containing protein [Vicinamibacterales bacterium]|jgi:ParB-like chromosome segregation protein Spo0J